MPYSIRRAESALLLIFIVSGLAGLIYQAVWSHYLGLTLGHAAYAQTLVLGIFMGGMALGAVLVSRMAASRRRLILTYAVIEGIVGVMGLLFHWGFVQYTDISQNTILPSVGSPVLAHAYQWISAALLILPQSILLGATFPLMSAGYLRIAPADDSRILGGLYFSNSIGAAFGALFATFFLLPWVGMPGAMISAGVLNLVVAAAALLVSLYVREGSGNGGPSAHAGTQSAASKANPQPAGPPDKALLQTVLAASLITGATSFVYEVSWVRLLNLALGTTLHSFELMLSAFILGLALGGLYVRRRSSNLTQPLRLAGIAQVLMGIATLLSLVIYTQAFHWVEWVMSAVQRSENGYVLFLAGSAALAILVMIPAAFFAGMTLPLFTAALLRNRHGETVIGKVYASNTLGAIIGVLAAVHVLIPLVGVKLSLVVAGLADAALGVYLLRFFSEGESRRDYVLGAIGAAVVAAVTLQFARVDPLVLTSSVYRSGRAEQAQGTKLHYLRDGKTATVSLAQGADGTAWIATNGKSDASIQMDASKPRSIDEVTMVIASGLPLLTHPNPASVAVIGFGSGLSTHTVLGSPVPKLVNTIEIEAAMVEAAEMFKPYVARAYDDRRSQIRIDDARTYFATGGRKYDVIISEPSNPWVSGVAGLFTQEFYQFIIRHLNPNGLLVQWVQAYEISDPLVATMLRALVERFEHVDMYLSNNTDLIMLASPDGPVPAMDWSRVAAEPLMSELAQQGLAKPSDFTLRKLMDERTIRAYTVMFGAKPHSDYYPTVSLVGPKDRHRGALAQTITLLAQTGFPVLETLGVRPFVGEPATRIPAMDNVFVQQQDLSRALIAGLSDARIDDETAVRRPDAAALLSMLLQLSTTCVTNDRLAAWSSALMAVADETHAYYRPDGVPSVWAEPQWLRCDAPDSEAPYAKMLLQLLDATSRRDHASQLALARQALESAPAGISASVRESLLMLASLGAIGAGEVHQVDVLWQTHGKTLRQSQSVGLIQALVRAWAEVRLAEDAGATAASKS